MIATDKQIAQDWGWKCLKLQEEVSELRAQVERLHADGAVMRQSLEFIGCRVEHPDDSKLPGCPICEAVDKALSTSCGADLLARYRETVELLRDPYNQSIDWATRRDTLPASVKGDL